MGQTAEDSSVVTGADGTPILVEPPAASDFSEQMTIGTEPHVEPTTMVTQAESIVSSRVALSTVLILDVSPPDVTDAEQKALKSVLRYNLWSSFAEGGSKEGANGKTLRANPGVMRSFMERYLAQINELANSKFVILSEDTDAIEQTVHKYISAAVEKSVWSVYRDGVNSLPEDKRDGIPTQDEFEAMSGIDARIMMVTHEHDSEKGVEDNVTHVVVKIHFKCPFIFTSKSPEKVLGSFLNYVPAALGQLEAANASMDFGVAFSTEDLRNQRVQECLNFCSSDRGLPNMFSKNTLRDLLTSGNFSTDFASYQQKYPILTFGSSSTGEDMDLYFNSVFGNPLNDILFLSKFTQAVEEEEEEEETSVAEE